MYSSSKKSLYKILVLYENMQDEKTDVTLNDYLVYLNRQFVRFVTLDNEIAETIKGLCALSDNLDHKTVKSVVFHLMHLADKKGLK